MITILRDNGYEVLGPVPLPKVIGSMNAPMFKLNVVPHTTWEKISIHRRLLIVRGATSAILSVLSTLLIPNTVSLRFW
jgi:ribosomal protein S10